MKDKILKIIHGTPQSEPIPQLELEYKKLPTQQDKDEFFSIIRTIAIEGTEKEIFVCLAVIRLLNMAKESEGIVKINVGRINFNKDKLLINPLLWLCAAISKEWCIDYIREVMKFYKPMESDTSYLYDMSLRAIVSTSFWQESIEEINLGLSLYDDIKFIDFIAFFKWKNGESISMDFINHLDNLLIDRVNKNKPEIDTRYSDYHRLKLY